jgi:stage III sporulation protein AG
MKNLLESLFGKNNALAKRPEYWLKIGLLGLAGVVLLVLGSAGNAGYQTGEGIPPGEEAITPAKEQPAAIKREEDELAERLRTVLRKIEGAGAVEVTVHLAGSTRTEYAVNAVTGKRTTEESDKAGANRLTTEDNNNGQVVVVRNGQRETAVIEREEAPRILGVLVVADGAVDPEVKARIFQAVRVALGVDTHRVLVLPRCQAPPV